MVKLKEYGVPDLKVKEIMAKKVETMDCEDQIEELLKKIEEHDYHSYPVLKEGEIIGIVTKEDVLRIFRKNKLGGFFVTHVTDIMTPSPITIEQEAYIRDAMHLMIKNDFTSLPVVDANKFVGLISLSDIVPKIFKF